MPHAFPLVGVCEREDGEAKVCDESFRITVNLLELIVGVQLATSCHIGRLKASVMRLFKSCIIITVIVGFYGLTMIDDLLPLC